MNRTRHAAALLTAALMLPPALPAPAHAQEPGLVEYRGATALGLSLRKLGTTKRVLMVGAHPDDEDTQLLARFALEEGADVAYLSLTRGEGGQNGIGPELAEGLGLLRTEELLAARRVDGAEQRFTRAYDFGYSKTLEETLRLWPREELLRDVVGVIRDFRPDIVITVFSGTPRDGHGHHQASALIALEAFDAAGDPARFPDQVADGLEPWRPAKLYRTLRGNPDGATVRIPIGTLDPLTGRSSFQLAMASRSRHRSQDMGRPELAGPRWGTLLRVLPAPDAIERSVWEGIDTVFAGTTGYRAALAGARATNPAAPDPAVPALARLVASLGRPPGASATAAAEHRRRAELRDAERALTLASGVVLDALAERSRVVPGSTVEVELQLWNGGARPLAVDALEPVVPAGWSVEGVGPFRAAERVEPGVLLVRRFRLGIPADGALSTAYFLRGTPSDTRMVRVGATTTTTIAPPTSAPDAYLHRGRNGGPAMYDWPRGVVPFGAPFEPPAIRARAVVRIADGAAVPVPFGIDAEATFREVDLRRGELRRPVLVVPPVSVRLEPGTRVVSTRSDGATEVSVRLTADAPEGIAGILRVRAEGWRAEIADSAIAFAGPGEVRDVRVRLLPTGPVNPGRHPVHAEFVTGGRIHADGVRLVDYEHVRARPLLREARGVLSAFDLRVPTGLRVAYVEGAGEEGPRFLADLGIAPVLLGAADLAEGDLDRFDVIVIGSRAYEVRDDLVTHNARLLGWVERGGTMIVQYNKYELVQGGLTPYSMTMARPHGRVTDPASPVRLLEPEHPALSWPNRIGPDDFAFWVQERGLYFADEWAPEYTPLLETGDAGQALRGGLLVARHGRGTWVYTGLALFRQLPEGVPGAYRLFANLLALAERR